MNKKAFFWFVSISATCFAFFVILGLALGLIRLGEAAESVTSSFNWFLQSYFLHYVIALILFIIPGYIILNKSDKAWMVGITFHLFFILFYIFWGFGCSYDGPGTCDYADQIGYFNQLFSFFNPFD